MSQLNLIGTTLSRFEIISELGRGGMAVVYKARQTDLDRIVALKILPPEMTHDSSYIARFRQEARSAARLEHPHIMPVYEVGEANGLHYIAMKFIQGRTLKDLVQAEGALSVQHAAQILAQVGEALDHAHRQGVIHRDIKPSNIMITDEGWVYLTDFGLARGTGSTGGLTMAGTVMGTPEYMSPEQAQGLANVGPPTDIYALGVVLYELITGTFPFKADTPMGMLAARLLQAPTPPRDIRGDLPNAVEDVVMRALARKPEARFASAADMVANLRAATGISATPTAQRPVTPMAGVPAMGDTIRATPIATPVPPIPTPQYVRQPASDVSAGRGAQATPGFVGTVPSIQPTIQSGAAGTQAPAQKRGNTGRTVAIALGVAVLGMVVILAMSFFGGRRGPDVRPTPVVNTTELQALIDAGDKALGEDNGMDSALDSYHKALDASPGSPLALEKLALAYNLRFDWPNAEEYANELIDSSQSDDRQLALGYTLLADALASQGDPNSAMPEVQKAIELDSNLSLTHAIHSNILAAQARAANDTNLMDQALDEVGLAEDAIADETPLIQALTYNANGYTFAQERFLSGNEDYMEQSEQSYERAIELQPGLALFHVNLGYLRSAQEEYDSARDNFEDAINVDSSFAAAQTAIGWSYYDEGDADKAATAFDAAIDINPGDYDPYFGKGRIAFDKKDYSAAVDQLRTAVSYNKRNPNLFAWLGESLLFYGFEMDTGDAKTQAYADAEQAYRSAIAINERSDFAISGLAWILQYQERYDESIKEFDHALQLNSTNDENYSGKGWSLFWLNRYAEAEQNFRRATELDTEYADAQYGLGRALEELGRKAEARAAYQEALRLNPDLTGAQDGLDRLGS